tara:strand:+ start:6119 stop:6340 length:222 start_codon:yes stop_codon:yes gene_type:complete
MSLPNKGMNEMNIYKRRVIGKTALIQEEMMGNTDIGLLDDEFSAGKDDEEFVKGLTNRLRQIGRNDGFPGAAS